MLDIAPEEHLKQGKNAFLHENRPYKVVKKITAIPLKIVPFSLYTNIKATVLSYLNNFLQYQHDGRESRKKSEFITNQGTV